MRWFPAFLCGHSRHPTEFETALIESIHTMTVELKAAIADLTAEVVEVKTEMSALIAKIGALPDDSADVTAINDAVAALKASVADGAAVTTPPVIPEPPVA